MFDLTGKAALVTGASGGIGGAIATALHGAGAVVGLSGTREAPLAELAAELGERAHVLPCDLSDMAAVEALPKRAVEAMGALDILVNNAGIIRRAPAVDYSPEDWHAVLQINLNALFFLSQAAARVMLPQGSGKIVNIASMLSYQGGILVPAYTAAKSAVAGLTKALANEWAAQGVNVNAIAPGYMATDNTAPLRADAQRNEAIVARIPAGRWGEASDLGGAVVFLASSASDYVQGITLPVDGGWLSR